MLKSESMLSSDENQSALGGQPPDEEPVSMVSDQVSTQSSFLDRISNIFAISRS